MYKLQTALCQKGVFVKINQQQNYSKKTKRMVTKYVLKNGKDIILETYQQADVVKKLAELYGGV